VASSPWEIRKTHYWHKKSQFGKRLKILATVKSVKNKDSEQLHDSMTLFSQACVGRASLPAIVGLNKNRQDY
jgi:hypothetical protein